MKSHLQKERCLYLQDPASPSLSGVSMADPHTSILPMIRVSPVGPCVSKRKSTVDLFWGSHSIATSSVSIAPTGQSAQAGARASVATVGAGLLEQGQMHLRLRKKNRSKRRIVYCTVSVARCPAYSASPLPCQLTCASHPVTSLARTMERAVQGPTDSTK